MPRFIWLCLCLGGALYSAVENAQAAENRWTHYGLRPLGMGNAYVGVADDYNAVFYNPGGLARLPNWDLEIINPTFTTNTATIQLIKKISQQTKDSSAQDEGSSKQIEIFTNELGKNHFGAIPLSPHFVGPGYGMALGIDDFISLVPHGDVSMDVEVGSQALIPVGFGMNFFDKRLSLGATAKLVGRIAIDERMDIDTLSLFLNSSEKNSDQGSTTSAINALVESGWGLGCDMGLLFTPEEAHQATLGISVADVGDTSYQHPSSMQFKQNPPARQAAVNTGVSFRPINRDNFYLLLAMDAQMVNQAVDYSHKLNSGAELGLGKRFKIQGGMKEGYLTAGFQMDLWLVRLRLATYVVDHGPVVGLNDNFVERRISVQMNLFI
jgi:hypothetical protein